jgi:hypothetical protein
MAGVMGRIMGVLHAMHYYATHCSGGACSVQVLLLDGFNTHQDGFHEEFGIALVFGVLGA